MKPSSRVSDVSTSLIRRMFEIVERARKEGKEIINLSIGEPDFKTPPELVERAYEYMKAGYTHYTSNLGLEELRVAIAERYNVEPSEVMVTTGGSEGLLNASLAFIDEGCNVIIPSPNFLSYFTYAKICRARVIQIRTHEDCFEIDPDRLNEVMRKNSFVFLNYPNNPTGVVVDGRVLKEVVEIARDKDSIVLSDEIYDRIHYDRKPRTLAGEENVIVVNGFSKSLAMTGWRIGFVIANENLLNEMLKVHQVNGVCAPAFAQKAVAEFLPESERFLKVMVREFRRRRDFVYSRLKRIFDVVKPEGAFYMFPDVGMDCEHFCERILIEKGVCLTPGRAFGDWNERYVRLSFANSMENLKKALDRIEEYVEESGEE
ncbi:MAG: aspartate aminotransferase [Archaeoglobales archaeon]|nr:MAG: aspartate aminotransferase [Archaeoglobales archaeon]